MKKLKLGFTDTFEAIAEFFIDTLSVDYEIIRDDANPDYLIFGDRNFGNNNLNYKNCIKIFYTGENQRPWEYQCHYAITFDHFDTENHYRLPLYVIYNWDNKRKGVATIEDRKGNGFKSHYDSNFGDYDRRGFCSFVVKNPNCQRRNDFFKKLNQYRPIASAGPLFNNMGFILPHGETAVQEKLSFLPNYRFNLCFENSSWPGYATEKLYEALIANTIPIYWGSPTITLDFNPKAFLNWHDYQDDDAFIKAIIEVDQSHKKFKSMLEEDPLSPMNTYFDMNKFRRWFSKNVYRGVIN
jgi:alpha(1,3/1,4) fucosyltransferase